MPGFLLAVHVILLVAVEGIPPISSASGIRRVLHQPLVPIGDVPSTATAVSPPSIPAEPPDGSDQPFFPEVQAPPQTSRTSPPSQNDTARKTLPESPKAYSAATKTVAIAASVGIVTLGMISALVFFFHRRRRIRADESQKLQPTTTTTTQDNSTPPPPPLYIGTVAPSSGGRNSSPHPKINGARESDRERYRPSPDLQPLPPLTMPPPPVQAPAISSSDDETSSYQTPHGSSPASRKSYVSGRRDTSLPSLLNHYPPPFPHSRRTSPKSRFSTSSPSHPQETKPPSPPPPPPPPPPPRQASRPTVTAVPVVKLQSSAPPRVQTVEIDEAETGKPKLKALHWDKVPTSSDRATVWDGLNSGSFQLNEDMMETLFGCNSAPPPLTTTSRSFLPPLDSVLDPKKSQNIAILLRALNVTGDEVSEALLEGSPDGLGPEFLETLVKMAPTKEEERKLKDYNGDSSKLGSAERFLKTLLHVPFAFKRIEIMLYRADFENEVKYLRKSYHTLEMACEELRRSPLFRKLLEAVLRAGNRMNVGTNRGDAEAFKLDTLLKLADVKGADGKTTLLHFVVQELIRSEGGHGDFKKMELMIVSGLSGELESVKRAAGMDSDVLSSYVSKLESGLRNVSSILRYEQVNKTSEGTGSFFVSTASFVEEAEEKIRVLRADGKNALLLVKDVTQYFHGEEEAHPFRIFVIVRDFLSVLDHVCKDVGRMRYGGVVVGSGRSFLLPLPGMSNGRRSGTEDNEGE